MVMESKLGKKFYVALIIFSLVGQVAWVVENMYFNVFIYKMFRASASDISLMVACSAVTAALTTIFIGALSDKVGKRKIFICGGYIAWGISILAFSLLRLEWLTALTGSVVAAASLGVTLVIMLDCVMTFFGSTANDACFNAWLTESGNESNRGKIEGINAMMPLIAILVVFGGFMAFDLEQQSSWNMIYLIIGTVVTLIGVCGFFLIDERDVVVDESQTYFKNIVYGFKPSVIKENKLLYSVILAFAIFGISIQVFMPYLILYYEQGLKMSNYVVIMAPAIIIASIVTLVYGRLFDMLGFKMSIYPAVFMLMIGFVMLYVFNSTIPVFIGSLLMMSGYLSGSTVFGAKMRDNTPIDKVGSFQGVRIVGQVLIPGVIGPMVGAWVLKDADVITNSDGTTSFLPNSNIFIAAFMVGLILLIVLHFIFKMIKDTNRDLATDFEIGDVPFNEYPRPQLKRDSFFNLNGLWDNGIKVPFPLESKLSMFNDKVPSRYVYTTSFTLPIGFVKDRVLLHFGAVDQVCEVYVNNKKVAYHEDGYLPFVIDITDVYEEKDNELRVEVIDELSTLYPVGKQSKKRGGMWYTPVSGIWQTVWIESVTDDYIKNITITPDLTGIDLVVDTSASEFDVIIENEDGQITKHFKDKKVRIDIDNPILWTVDKPYLYNFKIKTEHDEVESYFGLRKISIIDNRICLNNEPIFLHAVLDQGYFSDGIYLPGSYDGYRFDISKMKELGFNTLRKHIKIEPDIFYYLCDSMGMLVMQDMVNNGKYSFIKDTALPTIGIRKKDDSKERVSNIQKQNFIRHSENVLHQLYNHPSIIYYTIFNEGWGQFESDKLYDIVKQVDNTRIIDSTSGWFINNKSDVDSTHLYFDEKVLDKTIRPHVLSEFGGYAYCIEEHSFSVYNQHGYAFCNNEEELTDRIVDAYNTMVISSIENNLCGSVYTQLSDVEDEVNGLYTYDRKICKVNKDRIKKMSESIYNKFDEETKKGS